MSNLTTPDYYDYPWSPINSALLTDGWVTVSWSDGLALKSYQYWLTENAAGRGIDSASRESTTDPADIAAIGQIEKAEVGTDGSLLVTWPNGQQAPFHPGWLRHIAETKHRPDSYLPQQVTWDTDLFEVPPTIDGTNVLTDKTVLLNWLTELARYGIARLANTRADRDSLEELLTQVGPIRSSNFGSMFTVEYQAVRDTTASSSLNLGQHSDLPTRETPPGFQFLHCVENTVSGGSSRLTDGKRLVAELSEFHPADYEALTTLRWIFFNRSPDCDHRWSGPIIDHANPDQPLTLRAFYPVRAFPDMDEADVPRAYEAMATFSRLAHDPRFQLSFEFTPGDVIGFDNRRVLHGRDAFEPSQGTRVLRGAYLDQDDLYSTLRVLTRRAESETE